MAEFLIYFAIGITINLLYDLLVDGLKCEELRFNMRERAFVTLIWPIYLVTFVIKFLTQVSKKNKDD